MSSERFKVVPGVDQPLEADLQRSFSFLHDLYAGASAEELIPMEPSDELSAACTLRYYQKQALGWMVWRECSSGPN